VTLSNCFENFVIMLSSFFTLRFKREPFTLNLSLPTSFLCSQKAFLSN